MDQPSVDERTDAVIALDSSDSVDLADGDRLAVGDDRQNLQEAAAEAVALGPEEVGDQVGELAARAKLVPAGDSHQFDRPFAVQVPLKHIER
ncbi:MAG: hypothetical protein AMXMBFR19_18340 [Chthonomonadaceae bacterium]